MAKRPIREFYEFGVTCKVSVLRALVSNTRDFRGSDKIVIARVLIGKDLIFCCTGCKKRIGHATYVNFSKLGLRNHGKESVDAYGIVTLPVAQDQGSCSVCRKGKMNGRALAKKK